jgi:hypothetical protein
MEDITDEEIDGIMHDALMTQHVMTMQLLATIVLCAIIFSLFMGLYGLEAVRRGKLHGPCSTGVASCLQVERSR